MLTEKVKRKVIRTRVNIKKLFRRLSVRPVFTIGIIAFCFTTLMSSLDIPYDVLEGKRENRIQDNWAEGYTFEGWYVDRDFQIPYEGDFVRQDTLLFPKWTPQTFIITLDKQGGVGGPEEIEITEYDNLPQIESPEKTEYVFGGYFQRPGGQGEMFYNENMESLTQWEFSENMTLYAYWHGPLTISLDKTGGQGGDSFIETTYTKKLPNATAPQRRGYVFQGYFSEREGQGTPYYDGQMRRLTEWDRTNETTLYAHWKSIEDISYSEEQNIYIGEYPQELATSQAVDAMQSQSQSEGYYISDYDSQKYIKVKADPHQSGYKFTNGEEIVRGKEYYFKIQPLKWRIINQENQRAQLIADRIIDNKHFSFINNNWKYSDVREQLNNDLYKTIFSIDEKSVVLSTINQTKYIYSDTAYQTTDDLYLLTEQEIMNWQEEEKAALVSDYARATGSWMSKDEQDYGYGYYLLRSTGNDKKSAAAVYRDQRIIKNYRIDYNQSGIRPAITVRTNEDI
ncbi:MAG: InlB B-repeat-containing protein [Bacillota bacterium]